MTFNEFIDAAVKAAKEMDHAHAMSEIMHIKCDDPLAKEILKRYERINHLIYFITGIRCGYEQFKASMSYGARLSFPAFELVLIETGASNRKKIKERWERYGGQIYKRRMIAWKTDPIWKLLSFFGFPFPPFDVDAGYGIESVDFDEALRLGVVDEYHNELKEVEMPPDPEWSLVIEDYMRGVCQRIIQIIK